ncbi:MAG TPA: poly-beta-1,6 N-acetyl-D-glucosamine export porin PgaA [Gallionella sp.]|nr:poly-beta-1,6 N-acetyl-D-glucosamine export porin PgaA [Gallionella sp.]
MKKIFLVWMVVQVGAVQVQAAYGADAKQASRKGAKAVQRKAAALDARYQEALRLHRQNKTDQALAILDELRRAQSNDPRYLYDYLAIASNAGKHDLVLEVAAKELDQQVAPAYVLEALATSQREKKQYDAALTTYNTVLKRFPGRVESQAGRVGVLLDAQRYKEAEAELALLSDANPMRPEVLECEIRLGDVLKQPMRILSATAELLKQQPENRFALRMRFYALKQIGAAHLAVQLTPGTVLSEAEQLSVERDQLAFDLRWARANLDKQEPAARWQELDKVIPAMWEICKLAEGSGAKAAVAQGGCGDLVEALADRRHMPEAIALYEKMVSNHWAISPYVQVAVANAYLYERQPEQARDIFTAVLAQDPNNFDARQGYVYALLECGQYDLAYSELDRLTANTSEWINPKLPGFRDPNPAFLQAQKTNALVRTYTNRMAEGESIMQMVAQRSPNNPDAQRALATIYHLRGWPRRAESELQMLAAGNPADAWNSLGLFENRMAIGDFRGADQELKMAVQLRPEERVIQQAQREWDSHNLSELVVDSRIGQGSGGNVVTPNGSHERHINARLYSRPLLYGWRILGHTQLAWGDYPGLAVSRNAAGVGAEYRMRDYTATADLHAVGTAGAGFSLDQTYHFNDYWSISGLVESKSLSTPLRAYADGTSATDMQLGVSYRASEARSAQVRVNQMNLTDGNQRNAVDAAWVERLKASPTYLLDLTIEYYASRNSSQNPLISYFNPVSDRYAGVAFRNEWLQYQRYEKSLRHVLTVGGGRYAQQNFANGNVMSLRYEQIYRPTDRLELRYGIMRTNHPYDGVLVIENSADISANWMF